MKNQRLLLLVAFSMLSMFGYSQIQYEGTHDDDLESFQLDNGETKYARYSKSEKTISLYNVDLSEWKTVQLDIPKRFSFDDLKSITVNVFNADELIELAYTCAEYRSNSDIETTSNNVHINYTLYIINEEGELVFEAENGNGMKIVDSNGTRKLMVYKQTGHGSFKKEHIDVYALPDNMATVNQLKKSDKTNNYTSDHVRGI